MSRKMLNPAIAATVLVMLYTIVPVMSVIISSYLTTYSYMLVCVVLFVFIALAGGTERFGNIVYILLPLIAYVACTFFLNKGSILLWGYQSLLFVLPVILGYYCVYYRENAVPVFSKIITVAIVITAITTIIGIIRFPEASRILATIATSDDEINLTYAWNNIGGYSFVYTCVLLYPSLILAYKMRKISVPVFLFMFFILLVLIIYAEYTIALLLLMITSVLFFISKKATVGQMLIVGIILSAAVFIFQSFFENFLLWLANTLQSDTMSARLTALAGGLSGLENSEGNRIELYRTSLFAFFESPIFGSMFDREIVGGGHSFILDTLANYGIVGGATVFWIYKIIYKFFFKPFKHAPGYGFILWSFIQAIILSIVNTNMWLSVLCLFIPVLLSSIYNSDGDEYYENPLDS